MKQIKNKKKRINMLTIKCVNIILKRWGGRAEWRGGGTRREL